MIVLLVAAAKILDVKAGKSIQPAGWLCQPAASFVPATDTLVEVDFCKLICLEQSISLRYL